MVELVRNPPIDDVLRRQVVDCWVAVTNAGGAVGFVPPTSVEEVRPTADAALDRCAAGTDDLVVARDGAALAGVGFLSTNTSRVTAHWGTIVRLQRDPRWRGGGVGAAILGALEDAARDRGLRRVCLTTRSTLPVHDFYVANGYQLEATLPARLMIDGEEVAEHVLSKPLAPAGVATAAAADAPQSAPAAPPSGEAGDAPVLPVVRLDPDLPLPTYAHPGDAGLDLHARIDVALEPGERALVPTGVAVAVPAGYVGLVHPRSGLAVRHGIGLVNAPGTIDAGYRGEVGVPLINHGAEPVVLRRGDRIAQLVVQQVAAARVQEVADLPPSARAAGGFGSTGR